MAWLQGADGTQGAPLAAFLKNKIAQLIVYVVQVWSSRIYHAE